MSATTAEDIVRALAVLGADAVKRLEDAATACAQTETAMGEGYKVKHEVVQAEYGELEAARAALSAPLCMARAWVAANPVQSVPRARGSELDPGSSALRSALAPAR